MRPTGAALPSWSRRARCCTAPPFRFGAGRMRSVVDGINDELIGMIDPAEAVREVRSWGIHIDYDDELAGELDGLEDFA